MPDARHNETYITIETPSDTGQGTHKRWKYLNDPESPEDHPLFSNSPLSSLSSIPSESESEAESTVDQRFVTPAPRGVSVERSILDTPPQEFRRHIRHFGAHGIPIWRNGTDVFQQAGYTTMQALNMQRLRGLQDLEDEVHFLIAEKVLAIDAFEEGQSTQPFGIGGRLKQEEEDIELESPCPGMCGYDTDDDEQMPRSYGTGRHGERLGPQGTHLLGQNGTELFNFPMSIRASPTGNRPLRAEPTEQFDITNYPSQQASTSRTVQYPGGSTALPKRQGARLGPHGTEIIELGVYVPPKREGARFFSFQDDESMTTDQA